MLRIAVMSVIFMEHIFFLNIRWNRLKVYFYDGLELKLWGLSELGLILSI